MSRARFAILVTVLVCNAAALLVLARFALHKSPATAPLSASIELGRQDRPHGIQSCEVLKDGVTEPAEIAGSECRVARRPNGPAYFYFSIDPVWKQQPLNEALITVEYFDSAPGEFRLTYDAVDPEKNKASPYMMADEKEKCLGSQRWRNAHFVVRNARFRNSENGGADFRIDLRVPELHVRRVTLQPLNQPR